MSDIRYLSADIPEDLEKDILASAQNILGDGYTPDYYASVASSFTWLYRCGFERGVEAERKRVHGKKVRPCQALV